MCGLKVSPYLQEGLKYIKKDLCNKINQRAFMIGSVGLYKQVLKRNPIILTELKHQILIK